MRDNITSYRRECEICNGPMPKAGSFKNTGVCCEACRKVRDGDRFEVIKSVN